MALEREVHIYKIGFGLGPELVGVCVLEWEAIVG